jgi:type I restriction enzyme, S subunit
MKSDYFANILNFVSDQTTIRTITVPSLVASTLPVPSLPEQQAIADFLDRKIAQIDTLIAKKKRQIELLQEQRTALINSAVTKGLNPAAPMKDSGVEWLGEIPNHWGTVPLKYVCYMKGRIGWQGLTQAEFTDEGPYLITGMNFKNGKMNWDECYHISEERFAEAPEIHVEKGDVLITKDGTIGKLLFMDYLPGPTSLNSHLLILRPLHDEFNTKYLYYLLHSNAFQKFVDTVKTGTTFYGITQASMGDFKMFIFDKQEQQAIVDFLDDKLKQFDTLIDNVTKQIKLYEEYRTALISEAVTGKIDVRTTG